MSKVTNIKEEKPKPLSATSEFLLLQIANNVSQALGIDVTTVKMSQEGELAITAQVTDENAGQNTFWKAILETFT